MKTHNPDIGTLEQSGKSKVGTKGFGGVNYKYQKLEQDLGGLMVGLGMVLTGIPPTVPDGLVLLERAQPFSHALTEVAKEHTQLYNFLVKMLESSVYVALGTEIAVLLGSIAHNHNMLPPAVDMRLQASGLIVDTNATMQAFAQAQQQAMFNQTQAQNGAQPQEQPPSNVSPFVGMGG